MTENTMPLGTRLGSMLLDHFIMTMIMMVCFIPSLITSFTTNEVHTIGNAPMFEMTSPVTYLLILGFALYFCKDIFGGRSIAKRILKLQVLDNASNEVASPIQCVIRNFFCIIWPLEIILTLIEPSRRLGDRIAGTKVTARLQPVLKETNIPQTLIAFFLAYGATALVFYIL